MESNKLLQLNKVSKHINAVYSCKLDFERYRIQMLAWVLCIGQYFAHIFPQTLQASAKMVPWSKSWLFSCRPLLIHCLLSFSNVKSAAVEASSDNLRTNHSVTLKLKICFLQYGSIYEPTTTSVNGRFSCIQYESYLSLWFSFKTTKGILLKFDIWSSYWMLLIDFNFGLHC